MVPSWPSTTVHNWSAAKRGSRRETPVIPTMTSAWLVEANSPRKREAGARSTSGKQTDARVAG